MRSKLRLPLSNQPVPWGVLWRSGMGRSIKCDQPCRTTNQQLQRIATNNAGETAAIERAVLVPFKYRTVLYITPSAGVKI